MLELNWLAIGVVTLANFIVGSFWFGPIFGKIWMRIHHGDKKFSDAEMQEMMQGMWVLMLAEFIATFLIIMTLAFLIKMIPSYSGIHLAFIVWIGFILPMNVSNLLWGNEKKTTLPLKIIISTSYRLVTLIAAGYILSIW